MTALAPTPSQIGQCDCPFNHFAPRNPAAHAPSRGSSGIRNEYWTCQRSFSTGQLSFELAPRVGVERCTLTEQQDDKAKGQRRFRRGNHEHEDDKRLPAEV